MTPLAWAVAASVAANLALGGLWLSARDEAASKAAQLTTVREVADTCSKATEDLEKKAKSRLAAARTERDAARRRALELQRAAQSTLSTPPIDPKDQCASIQTLGDDWLRRRASR